VSTSMDLSPILVADRRSNPLGASSWTISKPAKVSVMVKNEPSKDVIRLSPSELSVEECQEGFMLMLEGTPILTPAGDAVVHTRSEVIRHILDEFDAFGKIGLHDYRIVEPKVFSAFALYGLQKELIESQEECLSLHFERCLCGDGIFYPAPGPNEEMAQRSRWQPIYAWIASLEMTMPSLCQYWGENMDNPEEDEEFRNNRDDYVPPKHFVESIERIYKSLSPEHRSVVYALHVVHKVVLFPMLLALGKCNVNEYASGVMAVHGVVAEDWAVLSLPDNEHFNEFQQYRELARVSMEWLQLFPTPTNPADALLAEIALGESARREFKSSLRWHIHKKQHDEVITHACLKTIAAFLNSTGGVLMIGVEDNGNICGIEHDGFPNDDKFLLHLYNYIQEWLGNHHATRIKTELIEVNGKKVCRVECEPVSGDWAYLRRKGEEEFLVRIGPSSKPLKPSEIADYMVSKKLP
jgi:hypothetical protein